MTLPAPQLSAAMVILRVADLERARLFYAETLGLRATLSFPGFVFFAAGPVTLVINQPERAVASVTSGLTEVVFDVPDIHAAHAALVSRGVAFVSPPVLIGRAAEHDRWAAPFRDPDGHALSLTATMPRGAGGQE
jgi:catechol 2,3-dioxygenase-like lactoylglutathione lyase family enzyme